MKSAQFTTTSGHSWKTSINGTLSTVADYILGKRTNVGQYPVEKMEQVVSVEMWDENGNEMGSITMQPREKIKLQHVTALLGITKEEALEMAEHCDKVCLFGLCSECPHFAPCRRVHNQLMTQPVVNSWVQNSWFMMDLLYDSCGHRKEAHPKK